MKCIDLWEITLVFNQNRLGIEAGTMDMNLESNLP
jgi:hypothetical protein